MRKSSLLLAGIVVLVAGCEGSSGTGLRLPTEPDKSTGGIQSTPVRSEHLVNLTLFVEGADGEPATRANEPLFETRRHNPILAPDGHQVTLREWNAARGEISVKCDVSGTHAVLHFRNLIPNGVYTIWNATFASPGFDLRLPDPFVHLIGLGVLDREDASHNDFRASSTGQASITGNTPAGPLSVFGRIGGCALTDEFEWHVVGAYHMDGQTRGPILGGDGGAVEQFGFVFKRER